MSNPNQTLPTPIGETAASTASLNPNPLHDQASGSIPTPSNGDHANDQAGTGSTKAGNTVGENGSNPIPLNRILDAMGHRAGNGATGQSGTIPEEATADLGETPRGVW
ncbi:hypothetical protein PCANC_08515 [Puccinia coronata f. sp. avenae]|uniref:Uncharacterized protein n=1 Tax=Puccinia coronata f. sp. avenae TaxID=200324 RepID=A0A2N5RWI1_9BASI|nr:hypothetical protein PCANC_28143 [Puccinia coronata f. sp. avenae]PLW46534.1 hypothetical protein PCANC_08515 [Puccinia coronata f. sp. avenae]